ncbi:MAG: thiamine pyrophosphate-binding protein, partial [Flavobacteriales bacterium]
MKISDKISVQKIVEQCQLNGISDIVISPGSRNAPFIISFTNNPFFSCYSIVDERSAGYFALGIAQQKKRPVAIVCTSGTASLKNVSKMTISYFFFVVLTWCRASSIMTFVDGLR